MSDRVVVSHSAVWLHAAVRDQSAVLSQRLGASTPVVYAAVAMVALFVAMLTYVVTAAVLWAALTHGLPGAYRSLHRVAARLAKPMARRLADSRHVIRAQPYLPVLVIAIVGFIVIFWAADGFLDLVEELQRKSAALRRVDQAVYDFFAQQRTPGLTWFFTFFTLAGTPVGLGLIVAGFGIHHLLNRRYRWVIYLGVTTIAGAIMNVALKHYFVRPRPDLDLALRGAHGHSFPSGHAMGSIIAFGALAYLAIRGAKSWRAASAELAVAITTILAIALSRIYLGVHWISDIGAGLAVGLVWVLTCTVLYEVFRRLRIVRAARVLTPGREPRAEV